MGCSGTKDEVRPVDINTQKSMREKERAVTVKQQAINDIFNKGDKNEEILIGNEPPKVEFVIPKMNLVKRGGTVDKNVNLLIEDNTKVWDMS
jgi:hypothetical protein